MDFFGSSNKDEDEDGKHTAKTHIHSFIHSLTTKLIAVIGGVGAAAAPAADRIARSDVSPVWQKSAGRKSVSIRNE